MAAAGLAGTALGVREYRPSLPKTPKTTRHTIIRMWINLSCLSFRRRRYNYLSS